MFIVVRRSFVTGEAMYLQRVALINGVCESNECAFFATGATAQDRPSCVRAKIVAASHKKEVLAAQVTFDRHTAGHGRKWRPVTSSLYAWANWA
jgi:hypothetical protein